MKVIARKLGFIGGNRVQVGDVFECSQSEFSDKWMEKVEAKEPKPKRKRKPAAKVEAKAETEEEDSSSPAPETGE